MSCFVRLAEASANLRAVAITAGMGKQARRRMTRRRATSSDTPRQFHLPPFFNLREYSKRHACNHSPSSTLSLSNQAEGWNKAGLPRQPHLPTHTSPHARESPLHPVSPCGPSSQAATSAGVEQPSSPMGDAFNPASPHPHLVSFTTQPALVPVPNPAGVHLRGGRDGHGEAVGAGGADGRRAGAAGRTARVWHGARCAHARAGGAAARPRARGGGGSSKRRAPRRRRCQRRGRLCGGGARLVSGRARGLGKLEAGSLRGCQPLDGYSSPWQMIPSPASLSANE
eukprot:360832-Chlamydomonas_euryale.AAC.1